ncbi:MAG: hypothetical protein WBG43_10595, partial [Marinifilaceae bacterium]
MKRINYLFLLISLFSVFTIYYCSKNDFTTDDAVKINLIIKSDKASIKADNLDVISFSSKLGTKDCTETTEFYIDGVKIDGHTFKTAEVKEFTVYGMIG